MFERKKISYDDPKLLLNYAYRLLARQDYSEHKLRQKLNLRVEDGKFVDETVEKLKGQGFLSEENYSRIKIKSRLKQGKGQRLIKGELAQEKIQVTEDQLQEAFTELGTNQEEILESMVEKKLRRVNLEEITFEEKMKLKNKILSYLVRNGHGYDQCQKILKKYSL